MNFETENIEFKSQFTDEIYKEIIAFANTDGGIVYVGIDNDGNVVGLTDVDNEYTRITNGIRDAIMPDVTMCVKFTIQDNKVVRITVNEGTNKPYYLKSKGLKPSGVYVRQGTSSVPASPEQIRQMIKESDGDTFEEVRSLEQNLSFDAAAVAFKRYGVEFSAEKYRVLGMTQRNPISTRILHFSFRISVRIQPKLPYLAMKPAPYSVTARSSVARFSSSLKIPLIICPSVIKPAP